MINYNINGEGERDLYDYKVSIFSWSDKILLLNRLWKIKYEKMLTSWLKNYDKIRQCIKTQRHHFASKGLYSQSYGFSSSHIQIREWDHKESWALKNWYFWTVVLEKTLESPLDSKEIKPVNPENQPWIFIGRTAAEAEAPILWPPDEKSDFKKTLMLGKTEGRRRRLDGIINSMDMSLSKFQDIIEDREAWQAAINGVTKS